ncbi:hypothetical protein GGQ80_002971 [Sphingomonas jinjuensis]|uniref:Uncharacterized protein n=1 Tax=Sphingomonas jinjuensis TaxID=535907 RepID=A0A840FH62_9SPHN|nr:hypothetical protein [Sphingomonas jinjuensis]MBB4155054.1 hypothetical protein [Sphingomonas jinjuensis]
MPVHLSFDDIARILPSQTQDREMAAAVLDAWVEEQAAIVRSMGDPATTACIVDVQPPGWYVACEFRSANDLSYPINIRCEGRYDVRGNTPHLLDTGAGFRLVALLLRELGMKTRLLT